MTGKARIYFDHNATAPLRPEAARAIEKALGLCGNASSVHTEGRAAHALIEQARRDVAALAGVKGGEVIFTSGGTEANNLALAPGVHRLGRAGEDQRRATHLLVSAIEHPSVLEGHRFADDKVRIIPVLESGIVDLAALRALLEELGPEDCALVSVMLANNETGIIQPVRKIAALVHEFDGFVHSDAVQGAGRLKIDLADLGVDLVTLSAHKIGGSQGSGALIAASGVALGERHMRGGGQEGGRRSGTENLPGIAGFGAAAKAAGAELSRIDEVAARRDRLAKAMRNVLPGTTVVGEGEERLANTLCVLVPGRSAESLVIAFDLAGVAVSSGSACSSGKVAPSHVLRAMDVAPEAAASALRISLGTATTEQEIERFVEVWSGISSRGGIRLSAA
jgi:cysteine desulfurase